MRERIPWSAIVVGVAAALIAAWALAAEAQTPIDLNSAKFYWDWAQGTGSPTDGFRVKCGGTSGVYPVIAVVADPAARQYPVKPVIGGVGNYYCVVTAYNTTGESPPSGEVFFAAGVIPSSPSNLRVAP